jgi:hypothetical protein
MRVLDGFHKDRLDGCIDDFRYRLPFKRRQGAYSGGFQSRPVVFGYEPDRGINGLHHVYTK